MRSLIVLTLIAVTIAFGTGYLVLSIQTPQTSSSEDVERISLIKRAFYRSVPPKQIINLTSTYNLKGVSQLFSSYSHTGVNFPSNEERALYLFSKACKKKKQISEKSSKLRKAWIWEEFRCGERLTLPPYFFKLPPYVHPSGMSYAYLAFSSPFQKYRNLKWIRHYVSEFKVSELKEVKKYIGKLNSLQDFLVTVNDEGLHELSKGKERFLTDKYYFSRITSQIDRSRFEYRVYNRGNLENFLMDSPYKIESYKGWGVCFFRDGNICWQLSSRYIFQQISKSTMLILTGAILLIGILLWIIFTKFREKNLEDQRRRLALHVLTHELRTPIASMLLQVENMQDKFSRMDEELQNTFLRLSSDVFRLQRLTEMSRNYLKVQKPKKLVDFNLVEVDSIKHTLEYLLDDYLDRFEFEFKGDDGPFTIDTYWLGVALKNLSENALNHGEAPFKYKVVFAAGKLEVSVINHGTCQFSNLDQMTDAFIKGSKSEGTGLGLNIVRKIVSEQGGELLFSTSPICFTLVLKGKGD